MFLNNNKSQKVSGNYFEKSTSGGGIIKKDNNSILEEEYDTGISLDNSSPEIYGNLFINDSASAIYCKNNSLPLINRNNFYDSFEYAVLNDDENVTVNAKENYWGDPSGPSGEGPGSGSAVSKYVDYGLFLNEPPAIVAFAKDDTLCVPASGTYTVDFFFKNWEKPNDNVTLNIHEEHDWLFNEGEFTDIIKDTLGGIFSSTFTTPEVEDEEKRNLVIFDCRSDSNPLWMDKDSTLIITYNPAVNELSVLPDTLEILKNDSADFAAFAFDQHNNIFDDVDIIWHAEGGSIDEYGKYFSGETPGTYEITAEDRISGLEGKAIVHIVDEYTSVDEGTASFDINVKVFPNPSDGKTHIRFEIDKNSPVKIEIYDQFGSRRKTLMDKYLPEGVHEAVWERKGFESGIYFYRITTGNRSSAGKIIFIK